MTTPAPRCHLHLPITDSSGTVYPYASVTFNDPTTGQPTTEAIYTQPTGGNPITEPVFVDPAVIEIWTDDPVRLQIVAIVANNVRIQLDGVDLFPSPSVVAQTPTPMLITGADTALPNAVLMASLPGQAAFTIANPAAVHQHSGDSAGSVVLTGEPATDFDPNQTWLGYHSGEDSAANSMGSSALGPNATVQGANATIAGVGGIVYSTTGGIPGDGATVLSSENGTATSGSTTIGAANLAAQGVNMTLVGALNGPTSPSSTPDGAVALGPGNVVGASGVVKIGPNHPTSSAGPNHTSIGSGNISQTNGLPWAGAQTPVAIGSNTTLAGDPSTNTSSTDWFGGVGPLAVGVNSSSFNPSLLSLSGAATTQALLRVSGDTVVNGQPTYSNASTTLGFYGQTGTARPKVSYNSGDVVNNQLRQLCQVLAQAGLIYTVDVPVVTESGSHADGTQLEFAGTGQALQWKLPAGSPTYLAANPFTVASNAVVLNAANGPYPTRGCPALYSSGLSDVSVQGRFTFNPTGTNLAGPDPDFESGIVNWGGWDGSTPSWDSTRAKFGSSSLKVIPSGTASGARAAYGMVTTPGTQYTWSAWVYPTVAKNVRVSIEALDGSYNYMGIGGYVDFPNLPLNTWTRISTSGTIPVGGVNGRFLVGYLAPANLLTTDLLWVDAAMLSTGSTLLPYVDATGYHPHDRSTGLMVRSYNAQSVVGGVTQAVPTGYLVSRTEVRMMTGNSYSVVANLSSVPNSGDLLQVNCVGSSVAVLVNGSPVASFTDSTLNIKVKHGFRVCDTTSASNFQVYPFGF